MTPQPREYELALAVMLLAAAAFLIARNRGQTVELRQRAIAERNRRIGAEEEVERHTRNMDGALEKIQEQNERIARLERAGTRPATAKPAGPAARKRPAAGEH